MVEQVEEEIFQMIKNTPVRVGEKLPNEYHFSELFCRKTIRLESGISKRKKQLKSRNTPVFLVVPLLKCYDVIRQKENRKKEEWRKKSGTGQSESKSTCAGKRSFEDGNGMDGRRFVQATDYG